VAFLRPATAAALARKNEANGAMEGRNTKQSQSARARARKQQPSRSVATAVERPEPQRRNDALTPRCYLHIYA
jgi:hypothetical protein